MSRGPPSCRRFAQVLASRAGPSRDNRKIRGATGPANWESPPRNGGAPASDRALATARGNLGAGYKGPRQRNRAAAHKRGVTRSEVLTHGYGRGRRFWHFNPKNLLVQTSGHHALNEWLQFHRSRRREFGPGGRRKLGGTVTSRCPPVYCCWKLNLSLPPHVRIIVTASGVSSGKAVTSPIEQSHHAGAIHVRVRGMWTAAAGLKGRWVAARPSEWGKLGAGRSRRFAAARNKARTGVLPQ